MTRSPNVIIRSTVGEFEPRFISARQFLIDLVGEVVPITWLRSSKDEIFQRNCPENVFHKRAEYGKGWRNSLNHLAFFFFVIRRLQAIKPALIYACDLDTLIPSLIWRYKRNCAVIYDQFDPLSARTNNRFLQTLLDKVEYQIARLSELQISPNKLRTPNYLREDWLEIKNLFPVQTSRIAPRSDSPFILLYGGVLSADRGLLACLEAISKEPDWEFHIYGQGKLAMFLKSSKVENLFIHQPIPHDELMDIASRSHLYLAMYDPFRQHNRFTASNKLYEASQLGIPLLTNNLTAIGDKTMQFGLGWTVSYNNAKEIQRVLNEFSKSSLDFRESLRSNLTSFYKKTKEENDIELIKLKSQIKKLLGFGT